MTAELIKFGEIPPGSGGDFERCAEKELREKLPNTVLVITNTSLCQKGNQYEYDVIVTAPGLCEIIELKCIRPIVEVYEDRIDGLNDFSLGRIFTKINDKAKIVVSKINSSSSNKARVLHPLQYPKKVQWVKSYVVVPDGVSIRFHEKSNQLNVQKLTQIIKTLKERIPTSFNTDQEKEFRRIKECWITYKNEWTDPGNRTKFSLNRFHIQKELPSNTQNVKEFLALDQYPCKVTVRLKEYLYDPLSTPDELICYLRELANEMQSLRNIRHPYISCVIGHFQTGSSLVQVSDYFEGSPIENSWTLVSGFDYASRLEILQRIVDGLAYCHSRGIFHRNLSAANILINEDCDIRITGFEFSKNLNNTQTVPIFKRAKMDIAIRSPEELKNGEVNPRLGDIFQAGILFYRILENGDWPFENTLDYCTGGGIRDFVVHKFEKDFGHLEELIRAMLAEDPSLRPDLLSKVKKVLNVICNK